MNGKINIILLQQVLGGSSSIESLKNTEKVRNGTYYDKCKIARIRDITI